MVRESHIQELYDLDETQLPHNECVEHPQLAMTTAFRAVSGSVVISL